MGLRSRAVKDARAILRDSSRASTPVVVTAPDGAVATLTGFSTDISQTIDPDTGQAVSGRLATVTLVIEDLATEFPAQGMPRDIPDAAGKPWLVAFDDSEGAAQTFKVSEGSPDRSLGWITLGLEVYAP